ncbi:unnamed protein product [Prunus armeniaca]
MFENEVGNEPLAIQDLLVKSMTYQINYRRRQDPSLVCPERLQLWKDEINEDSEKKMKELWDIFIQGEKRSKELEAELATYVEKLDNEEYVTATMTVESTVQLQEIQNLKRRIAELERKETRIDMEKISKKKEIEEKYKSKKKRSNKKKEKKQDAPTPDVPSRVLRLKNRERKRLQASCYVYEKNKKPKKRAKKDDEELPQFKLISSEEQSTRGSSKLEEIETAMQCLTQEASQPDVTNPIPDPPKGMSLHDSILVGWGQKKVWQKIPKEDRDRIQEYYFSTQPRDNFWARLHNEKVTNHDIKDIVIEAYIQIEEEIIGPMLTDSPQYMSTWTWAYMQTFLEPNWHRALYEHLLEKLGKCNVLFFPIISSSEFHFTLLTFHKIERKWRHYNPLRSLGPRKEEKCIDIAQNFVNIVEGWLEYIRPQAHKFLETKKIPKLVKQKEGPLTPAQVDLSPNEELTLNWILQNPYQFPFEDDTECAQQNSSSLHCGMFVMFFMDKIEQGQLIPKNVDKNFMNEYRAQYVTKLLHHKHCDATKGKGNNKLH